MKDTFHEFIINIENLQLFALCKDFEELSLDDKEGSSSTSKGKSVVQPSSGSYGYSSTFNRFLSCWKPSQWSRPIIKEIRAPLIDLPRQLMDSLYQSYEILIGVGFRFLPGQQEFLTQELQLPKSFDRLSLLRESLGLTCYRSPISAYSLFPYSYSGAGLRCLTTDRYKKNTLVEVITYTNGMYGRFLVLVCLGIGCTVWYVFAPGSEHQAPACLLTPLESYDPFFRMDHCASGFQSLGLIETHDLSAQVDLSLEKEPPFDDIRIPASGPVLKAVGLGVMIAFFLAVGIIPIPSEAINVQ